MRVAAVQASYRLMDQDATIDRVDELCGDAAALGAQLVVLPETFVPGTPLWIDTVPIWDGDDEWYRLFATNAVAVPSPATERLGEIAARHGVWMVVGVSERDPHGGTIYNTLLYLSPEGALVTTHRKLVPTGSERTVWGMGDGSTLGVVEMDGMQVGGLICWENYMPLARFHLYAQGVELWLAPTLATGDGWVATMRHLARENRMYVVGVNPVLHVDQVPATFPDRDHLLAGAVLDDDGWLEPGNTVVVGPDGELIAGPVRGREETIVFDADIGQVQSARRLMDPVGHYHRPDVFRLEVDTRPQVAVVERGPEADEPARG